VAGVLTRLRGAVRMVFNGLGGGYPQLGASYGSYLGNLLPGSRWDYAREAGCLWQNSIVSICLGWKQRTFVEPRLQVCDVDPASDEETPVPSHPMVRLMRRPNDAYTDIDLLKAAVLSYDVDGNSYWMMARGGYGWGAPVQLWWIPHFMMTPVWESGGANYIDYYCYRVNGVDYKIDPKWIIHWRNGIDPLNTRRGLSPLAALLREVCGENEAANMTAAIMRNVGVPGLVISPADPKVEIPGPAAEAMKQKFLSEFTGERRGEPMVVSNAIKVDMPGWSPRDMMVDFLRKVPEERISAALGVPAILAGLGAGLERSTFANFAEARKAYVENTLMPMQMELARCLDHQLLPLFESEEALDTRRTSWNYSKVNALQEDKDAVHQRNRDDYTAGLISLQEGRQAIGRDAAPEGTGHTFKPDQDHARAQELAAARPAPGAAKALFGARWRARLEAERKGLDGS
jgi:HK97 family phage portal protein